MVTIFKISDSNLLSVRFKIKSIHTEKYDLVLTKRGDEKGLREGIRIWKKALKVPTP